jgi:small GTP-binding protein
MPEPRKLKVVVLGESGVGKTCVVVRYVKSEFSDASSATIGVAFLKKNLTLPPPPGTGLASGEEVSLEIWDTAGQEVYRTILPLYYKAADCVLLCYDVTSRETFTELKYWVDQIARECRDRVVVAVCGTKLDLVDPAQGGDAGLRQVTQKEAAAFARKTWGEKAIAVETSSRTGEGVGSLFEQAAAQAAAASLGRHERRRPTLAGPKRRKKGCC